MDENWNLDIMLGVLAPCGGYSPPQRGAFAPAPEINLDMPLIVEGDIAVTESSLGSGKNVLRMFQLSQSSLWPEGVVPYRIATALFFTGTGRGGSQERPGSLFEPVFLESQIENITQALRKIENDLPCIKFRQVFAL